MELHEILSTLREEKDMKQHEVAEKVHVTKSAISSYETGSSPVSYTHLDVYKRQPYVSLPIISVMLMHFMV